MDADLLVALIAPRPLLLQPAASDYWSIPKASFWRRDRRRQGLSLLGEEDLRTDVWPAGQAQPIFP